jgi:hypothetical protein
MNPTAARLAATAFSILHFAETGMLSGFFLEKKLPFEISNRLQVNQKCSIGLRSAWLGGSE